MGLGCQACLRNYQAIWEAGLAKLHVENRLQASALALVGKKGALSPERANELIVRTVLIDEMLVLHWICGCSDVGFSVYFICYTASSLAQNKAPLVSPFSLFILLSDKTKCHSCSWWDSYHPTAVLRSGVWCGNTLKIYSQTLKLEFQQYSQDLGDCEVDSAITRVQVPSQYLISPVILGKEPLWPSLSLFKL